DAPLRKWRLNPQTEIAERRSKQNGQDDIRHGEDEDRQRGIRHDVTKHDAAAAEAENLASGDEVAVPERKGASAHQPRIRYPSHEGQGDEEADEARPEDRNDRDHQHEERK